MAADHAFAYPSSRELQSWASSLPGELDDERAQDLARRLRRHGVCFTVSAALPSVVGFAASWILWPTSKGASDGVFWPLSLALAAGVIIATIQWRTIVCAFRPDIALGYHAAACVNRLRRWEGNSGDAALRQTVSYVGGRLADLEGALLSPHLTTLASGTGAARRVVQRVQAESAALIGAAETRWRARLDEASASALTLVVGQTLMIVELGGWFLVDPDPDLVLVDEGSAASPPTRSVAWLPRLADGLLSKGTELVASSAVSLLLLVLAGIQRGR